MEKLPVYQISKFNCGSEENDLYFNDFRSHLQDHDFIEKPHSHNFYLIAIFTKGSGTHNIDFDQFQIQCGHVYLLQPGQVHDWQLSQDIDGYIAFLSQQAYNVYFGQKRLETYSFFSTLKNSPEMILNAPQLATIKNYFDLLIAENNHPNKRRDKLLNLIDTVLIEFQRIYDSSHTHRIHSYNIKVNELQNLLQLHFKQQRSPSFYAAKMNLSLKHLNRICKTVLDLTLTEFIAAKIILEAKRLLSSGRFTVSEIATELGFDDYSYFTKVFKKNAGMTPQEFRKRLSVLG